MGLCAPARHLGSPGGPRAQRASAHEYLGPLLQLILGGHRGVTEAAAVLASSSVSEAALLEARAPKTTHPIFASREGLKHWQGVGMAACGIHFGRLGPTRLQVGANVARTNQVNVPPLCISAEMGKCVCQGKCVCHSYLSRDGQVTSVCAIPTSAEMNKCVFHACRQQLR